MTQKSNRYSGTKEVVSSFHTPLIFRRSERRESAHNEEYFIVKISKEMHELFEVGVSVLSLHSTVIRSGEKQQKS